MNSRSYVSGTFVNTISSISAYLLAVEKKCKIKDKKLLYFAPFSSGHFIVIFHLNCTTMTVYTRLLRHPLLISVVLSCSSAQSSCKLKMICFENICIRKLTITISELRAVASHFLQKMYVFILYIYTAVLESESLSL